jgi:hypothetical protein
MIGIDISILGQKQGKGKRVVVGRGGQDRNKRNRDGGDNHGFERGEGGRAVATYIFNVPVFQVLSISQVEQSET